MLARVDQPLRKRRWIDLRNTLFLLFLKLFRGRRWVVIWKHSPRPKVDLLYFHSISRIRRLSIVDLLCLLVVRIEFG